MGGFYIGEILCSHAVAEKVKAKHGVSLDEVKDAVQWAALPLRAAWLTAVLDPRGPRLALEGRRPPGGSSKVVLYPVDEREGTWRLGTAVALS